MPAKNLAINAHWASLSASGGVRGGLLVAHSPPFPTTAPLPRPPSPTAYLHIMIPLNHAVDVWTHADGRIGSTRVPQGQAVCWSPGAWCCLNRDERLERLRMTVQEDGLLVGLKHRVGAPPLFHLLRPPDPQLTAALHGHLCTSTTAPLTPADSRLHALNCLLLLTASALSQRPRNRATHDHLDTVVSYIKDHCHRDIGRDQVAAAAGISPTHCSRILAAARGHGVQEEILQQRIRLAAHLLRSTSLSIRQVSETVGIADASQFIRGFRRIHACTPGQWRQSGSR